MVKATTAAYSIQTGSAAMAAAIGSIGRTCQPETTGATASNTLPMTNMESGDSIWQMILYRLQQICSGHEGCKHHFVIYRKFPYSLGINNRQRSIILQAAWPVSANAHQTIHFIIITLSISVALRMDEQETDTTSRHL